MRDSRGQTSYHGKEEKKARIGELGQRGTRACSSRISCARVGLLVGALRPDVEVADRLLNEHPWGGQAPLSSVCRVKGGRGQ